MTRQSFGILNNVLGSIKAIKYMADECGINELCDSMAKNIQSVFQIENEAAVSRTVPDGSYNAVCEVGRFRVSVGKLAQDQGEERQCK